MICIGYCKILKCLVYGEKSGQFCQYWAFRECYKLERTCTNCRRCDLTRKK